MANESPGRSSHRVRNESVHKRQDERGDRSQTVVVSPFRSIQPDNQFGQATISGQSYHEMARTLPRHFDAPNMQQSNLSQQRMPIPHFPNPHLPSNVTSNVSTNYSQTFPQHNLQRNQQSQGSAGKTLRRKQPFDMMQAIPPPTPPLAVPNMGIKTPSLHSRFRAPPSPLRPKVEKEEAERIEEGDYESESESDGNRPKDEDLRWSSDESTPTPTASSVAAASVRRRQEAKTMLPVNLVAPTQVARAGMQRETVEGNAPLPHKASNPGPSASQRTVQATPITDSSQMDSRPISASSVTLSSGQQVPSVRTDFENMKKITRPGSSSKRTNVSHEQSSVSQEQSKQQHEEKGKSRKMDDEKQVIEASVGMPMHSTQTNDISTSNPNAASSSDPKRSVLAQLVEYEPHQMTPVQEEEEEDHQLSIRRVSKKEGTRVIQGMAGEITNVEQPETGRSHRISSAVSLRRGSFESGTTALDTPRVFDEEGRASFEMTRGSGDGPLDQSRGGGNDIVGRHATSKALQTHRAIVSGLVAAPSDVMEVQEPTGSNDPSRTKSETPKSHGISSHLEQLNRFINSSIGQNNKQTQPTRSDTGKSAAKNKVDGTTFDIIGNDGKKEVHDHVKNAKRPYSSESFQIPITGITQRPRTGGSASRRPGTGQTRFSVEPPIAAANLRRALNSAGGRSRTFGLMEDPKNQHNKSTCRQCFRAGFDCAVQLHNGQGTGARKALQEFVAAGGLEALSGVEDFYEGSVWGSQTMGAGPSKQSQAPIRGQNFVDRLGEVAFGESALSRPVTRGAMQDMLEERGRVLTEQQHSKTVEQFLMELQRLQKEQEDEFALRQDGTDDNENPSNVIQEDGKAQIRSNADTNEKKMSSEKNAGYSSPQIEKNKSMTHINATSTMEDVQVDQSRRENDSQYDQESLEQSDTEDELPFLADRWSMVRKLHQLTIYAIWLFCIQCVSSGYSSSVPAIQTKIHAEPLSLNFGQFTFLLGQAGGLLFGACLSSLGRIRLPILSVLLSVAICVILGFMRSSFVIIALRGALGYLTGLYEIALIGMILDLSTNRRQRFGFLIYVLVWIISAQAAGPWIAILVIKVGAWPWLYWLTAIVGLVFMFFFAFITSETEACSIYRTAVKKLRNESAEAWTPEPRIAASWKEIILIRSIRPFVILVRHPIVILSTLVLAISLGSVVGMIDPLSDILQGNHQFASWKSTLLISICIALGLMIATGVILLFGVGSKRTSFSQRTRILFMDEKGIIDAQRPKFDAEQVLHVCVTGLILLTVGLYMLALTATKTNWIFCAVCLVLCVTGVTLLSVGLLHFMAESYYPAAFSILGEVLALSDSVGPAPHYANVDRGEETQQRVSIDDGRTMEDQYDEQRQDEQEKEKEFDDHTLMSGANHDGKRWDSNWALNVIGTVLGFTMVLSGVASFIGRLAAFKIGFTLYVAILATIVLIVSGLALILLVRYGHRMRKNAFEHIAKTEQHIWQQKRPSGSDANMTVGTSTGVTRSRHSTLENGFAFNRTPLSLPQPAKWKTGLKQFLLPTLRSSHEVDEGLGGVQRTRPASLIIDPTLRSKIRNWMDKQKRSKQEAQNEENREKIITQISSPFDAQHLASGANLIEEDRELYDAFGVQYAVRGGDQRSKRRSILINDGQMPSFHSYMRQQEDKQDERQISSQYEMENPSRSLTKSSTKPINHHRHHKKSISNPAPFTPTPKTPMPIASPTFASPIHTYERAQTPPAM